MNIKEQLEYKKLLDNTIGYYEPEERTEAENNLMKFVIAHTPNKLYHYRPASTNSIEAFESNSMYFNTASNFNDPYDCLTYLDKEKLRQEISMIGTDDMKRIVNSIVKNPQNAQMFLPQINTNYFVELASALDKTNFVERLASTNENSFNQAKKYITSLVLHDYEAIKNFYQNYYPIVCLSETWNNVLMWSHYADSHRGFVLEYNTQNLTTPCTNCPKNLNSSTCPYWATLRLLPILYTNQRYNASHYVVDFMMHNLLDDNYKNQRWNDIDSCGQYKINIYKHKAWSYEKEWRLMFNKSHLEQPNVVHVKPSAIYLGCRIRKCHADILIQYAIKNGIKVYKMSENPDSIKYRLTKHLYKG